MRWCEEVTDLAKAPKLLSCFLNNRAVKVANQLSLTKQWLLKVMKW